MPFGKLADLRARFARTNATVSKIDILSTVAFIWTIMKNTRIKIILASVSLVFCLTVYFFGRRLWEAGRTIHSGNSKTAVSITNPIRESSAEEIYARLKVKFHIPEGASEVKYLIIDGTPPIAQMDFVYKGAPCTARGCDVSTFDIAFPDISGLYYEWSYTNNCGFFSDENVIDSKLLYKLKEGHSGIGIGVVRWIDKNNFVYSVSCDGVPPYASFDAIDDFLMDLAGSIYGSIYVFTSRYAAKIRCGENNTVGLWNEPRIGRIFHQFTNGMEVYISKRTTQKQKLEGKEDFWYCCYYADEAYCYEGWIFGGDLEK